MKKIGLIAVVALAAAVAAPSALAAPSSQASPRAWAVYDCKVLRAQLGKQTFRLTYGTAGASRKDAFPRCVGIWRAEERSNGLQALRDCRAERAEGRAAFLQQYGTFGRCVTQKWRAESRADRRAVVNAARQCKAERGATPESRAAFREAYGGGLNAFGRCVRQTVKAQNGNG